MGAALRAEPQPVVACTISRDVHNFDLLVEDMEASFGRAWGDLGFADALAFLEGPDADALDVVALALDAEDEADLPLVADVVAAAKGRGVKVILVAHDVPPAALHRLLREGGDEVVPYPLPEGELARAIARAGDAAPRPEAGRKAALATGLEIVPGIEAGPTRELVTAAEARPQAAGDRGGVVIPVYGMAGGTGATTLAVNLAWELAAQGGAGQGSAGQGAAGQGGAGPKVCLLDLGLQSGAVATYLDLPRREAVLELLSDTEAMDHDSFLGALLPYGRLQVLTAPLDLVPLDLIGPADAARLIEAARASFDYVVIDMPPTMADWAETVLQAAHVGFATIELDMRSAQNVLRLKRALTGEGLPFEKLRFVLNRAPGRMDLNGRARVRRLAESLGIAIEVQLPDGGRQVAQVADHGTPLAEGAPKNPLRREIARLARSVHEVNAAEDAAPKARRA